MKIYVAHSGGFDFEKELYEPILNSGLSKMHEFILPHAGEVFDSKDIIKNCDLIVAEVSYPSTGEGIELGWADLLGKRMICLYKTGLKISTALDYLPCEKLEYSDSASLVDGLKSVVSR